MDIPNCCSCENKAMTATPPPAGICDIAKENSEIMISLHNQLCELASILYGADYSVANDGNIKTPPESLGAEIRHQKEMVLCSRSVMSDIMIALRG